MNLQEFFETEPNFRTLYKTIAEDQHATTCFFFENCLIDPSPICIHCHIPMKHEKYYDIEIKNRKTGFFWRCLKCRKKRSILKYSFWSQTQLELWQNIMLLYCFAYQLDTKDTIRELKVNKNTVTKFYENCRNIIAYELINESSSYKIGGVGMIVEVDEAYFQKHKYWRGRYRNGFWVIGGYCRNTGECFLVPVDARNKPTCQAVIFENIKSGSIIYTDEWKGYRNLIDDEGELFDLWTVNHSVSFVNENGIHTNSIEGLWMHAKKSLKGVPEHKKHEHFLEFIWRKKIKNENPFIKLIQMIAKYHQFK